MLGRTWGEIHERWITDAPAAATPAAAAPADSSLVPNLLPEDAIAMEVESLVAILRGRYGNSVDLALSAEWTDPDLPASSSPEILRGPAVREQDPAWLRRTNMSGINIRTVGTFPGVVAYALTLSAVHDSIHLLPVWEPGVVGSLYGMSSWKINSEFLSLPLARRYPHLNTPPRQLKATINLLHLMGKRVGMDVIPHTDRFSEIVLAHPRYFEWLRREDLTIVDHRADLHEEVEARIIRYLRENGVKKRTVPPEEIFSDGITEVEREALLFGPADDPERRTRRRRELAEYLYRVGYEPVPATMAPPYRGLEVDREHRHEDENGHIWREYRIGRPEPMSRVFGPLTRYKLYERLNDNRNWEIDFSRPRPAVWRYVQQQYGAVQKHFGFDFMRGDMSHVQMRPEGVPAEPDNYYDLLGSVRNHIRTANEAAWFGYFAETFVAPPGTMAYGDELDHLEASDADVTLGDLQSRRVDSPEFIRQLRWYRDIGDTRGVTPAFTVMTSDKDDPRFDEFYQRGNEARYFAALFLVDMPSYTGLNFACRDPHFTAAPNEHYTKLYVFHESDGPKATRGPFQFGRNGHLFFRISRIRLLAEQLLPEIRDGRVRWLLPPDATAGQFHIAWTVEGARETPLFVVNFGRELVRNLHIPLDWKADGLRADDVTTLLFSTEENRATGTTLATDKRGRWLVIPELAAGEGLVLTVRR